MKKIKTFCNDGDEDLQSTEFSYTQQVEELLPGTYFIKLKGFANDNTVYDDAKKPVASKGLVRLKTDQQIYSWINQGGWIGAYIPEGFYIVDIDDSNEGALLKDLLDGENVHHHHIKTPNGDQFVFRCSESLAKAQGQYSKYVNRLGLTQDARAPRKGYIVYPTQNTKGRHFTSICMEQLDELPPFLFKVWNAEKHPSPMAYPTSELVQGMIVSMTLPEDCSLAGFLIKK